MDFTELCHVSAVLFDCNIVKLPIELLQNVAQVLRIMYFLLKSILLYLYIVYFVQLYVSIGAQVNKQRVHIKPIHDHKLGIGCFFGIIIFFPLFSPR